MDEVKARIDWLMGAIEAEEVAKLDMSHTVVTKGCGTAACIYGFAALKEYGSDIADSMTLVPPMHHDRWAEYFGLDEERTMELFMAYSLDEHFEFDALQYLTKDDAVLALKKVREGTFESWSDTLPDYRITQIGDQMDEDLYG